LNFLLPNIGLVHLLRRKSFSFRHGALTDCRGRSNRVSQMTLPGLSWSSTILCTSWYVVQRWSPCLSPSRMDRLLIRHPHYSITIIDRVKWRICHTLKFPISGCE
jgi:hypothetical protein